jgi:hypothetical protein
LQVALLAAGRAVPASRLRRVLSDTLGTLAEAACKCGDSVTGHQNTSEAEDSAAAHDLADLWGGDGSDDGGGDADFRGHEIFRVHDAPPATHTPALILYEQVKAVLLISALRTKLAGVAPAFSAMAAIHVV